MQLSSQDKQDIIRAIIVIVIVIASSILVGFGKIDTNVLVVVFTGITSYYLGKTSSTGGLLS